MKYTDRFFKAIRRGDTEVLRELLEKEPGLVAAVAKAKRDAGQSPLQVALKTGQDAVAELLLDAGADVHFMEDPDCGSSWRAPVLHDAINMAVMQSRWNTVFAGELTVYSTEAQADRAYRILERVAEADVNRLDSAGNSALWRFCLQARQILPRGSDRVLTAELRQDLRRILALLVRRGAGFTYRHPSAGLTVLEQFAGEALGELLQEYA